MQIYILFYEIETNGTHLKLARVAITNINIVLDDELSQTRGQNRNTIHWSLWNNTGKKKKSNSCPSKVSLKYKLVITLLQRPRSALCRCAQPGNLPATGCMYNAGKQPASIGELRASPSMWERTLHCHSLMGCGIIQEGDPQQEAKQLHQPRTELRNWCKDVLMLDLIEIASCKIKSLWRFALCNHFLCQQSVKGCKKKTVDKWFRHWNLTLWNHYSVAPLSGDWSLFALSTQNTYISTVCCGCAPKHKTQLRAHS